MFGSLEIKKKEVLKTGIFFDMNTKVDRSIKLFTA